MTVKVKRSHHPRKFDTPPTEEEFWAARDYLNTIRQMAYARMAAPMAVLGITLARAITAVHPNVVLPPTVGGEVSLNLFIGITGLSGTGKDNAHEAARAVLPVHVKVMGIGSGEGIAHLYMRRDNGNLYQHNLSVLFQVREIKTLGAIVKRSASTLLPELCKAWMGHELGMAYVDKAKSLRVEPHAYRLCMTAGIQHANADTLLDDADSGTPQRWLWLPSTDPDFPEGDHAEPSPLKWDIAEWEPECACEFTKLPDPRGENGDLRKMAVCRTAVRLIKAAGRDRVTGVKPGDHMLLCQLKVAAALALLAERFDISEEDWWLASYIMDVSNRTRRVIIHEAAEARDAANAARGKQEGDRLVIVSEVVERSAVEKVRAKLEAKLIAATGKISRSALRIGLSSKDRPYFDEAIDEMVAEGKVVATEETYRGQESTLYEWSVAA